MPDQGRADGDVTAECLCGRKTRHLPTIDCYVVVFQNEDRSAARETGEEVKRDE